MWNRLRATNIPGTSDPLAAMVPFTSESDLPPTSVEHQVAHRQTWPWLPTSGSGILAPHPFCEDCGLIKIVGTNRGLDMGGLMNLISKLYRRLRDAGVHATEAQKRVVVKNLEAAKAHDDFGLSRRHQNHLVSRIVGECLGVRPSVVESYLRSC